MKSENHQNNITNFESFVSSMLEKNSQIIAVMVIDKDGKLIKKIISKSLESEFGPFELEYIAKLIGLRYRIVEFHKILNGLKMTINVFNERFIFVTGLADGTIIAMITKNENIEKTCEIMSQIQPSFVNLAKMLNQ